MSYFIPQGDTVISDEQRNIHVGGEIMALAVVAPFLAHLSTRRDLPKWARLLSGSIAAGTLLVDGWLLWKYATAKER